MGKPRLSWEEMILAVKPCLLLGPPLPAARPAKAAVAWPPAVRPAKAVVAWPPAVKQVLARAV